MICRILAIPWLIEKDTYDPMFYEIEGVVESIIDHECDPERLADSGLCMMMLREMVGEVDIARMYLWEVYIEPPLAITPVIVLISSGDDME